ncbi:hypothetical protein I7I48_06318 [Histoplasma ohiense]|nr:hypothetical protein I7I48_06318 [Histoplasma ohiense (nom. inval.)]
MKEDPSVLLPWPVYGAAVIYDRDFPLNSHYVSICCRICASCCFIWIRHLLLSWGPLRNEVKILHAFANSI